MQEPEKFLKISLTFARFMITFILTHQNYFSESFSEKEESNFMNIDVSLQQNNYKTSGKHYSFNIS